MKYLILLFSLLLSYYLSSQDLHVYENRKGLFGFKDENGKVIIKAQYNISYTNTLKHIAFVGKYKDKYLICIDRKGNKLFNVFVYDNGPDYVQEGLFRITNNEGLMGFADTLGNIIIAPQYKFANPFENGRAEVTFEGHKEMDGEHYYWAGGDWFFIENPLKK